MKLTSILLFFSALIIETATHKCLIKQNEEELKIANCSNRGLYRIPSDLDTDINVLDLSGNNLDRIENNSFGNYKYLNKLNLNKNKLSELSLESFLGLSNLIELNMSDNSLNLSAVYKQDLFQPIQNLTVFDICRNMPQPTDFIHTSDYPDTAIGTLTELSFLAIDMLPIPRFGIGFRKLRNLRHLEFQSCYLKRLTNETFHNFPESIEILELQNCNLHFVETAIGALLPLPNLNVLDLSDTFMHLIQALKLLYPFRNKTMKTINFHHVSDYIIDNKQYPYTLILTEEMTENLNTICVENLHLSQNGIVDYDTGSLFSFHKPECIQLLSIHANRFPLAYGEKITHLNEFFRKAINMKTFNYSYVAVNYNMPRYRYKDTSFVALNSSARNFVVFPKSLEQFDISHSIINDFPLELLFLKGNNLKYLDISNYPSRYNVFIQPDQESKLETFISSGTHFRLAWYQFSKIQVTRVKTCIFKNADLDSAMNDKTVQLFERAHSVQFLDISENRLWYLKDDLLISMKNLSRLYLGNNLLQSIPEQLFQLTEMAELDLRNNLLTTIDSEGRKWADSMGAKHDFTLKLDGNAFECSCDNIDFVKWIRTTKVNLDSRSYKCVLANGSVLNTSAAYESMNDLFADCYSSLWLTVAATVISAGIVTSLSLFVYSRRWNIFLFVYRKLHEAFVVKVRKKYTYDVYMSYDGGEDVAVWIRDNLLPTIENEWGLKMCIKDRDFLASSHTENIACSIHSSRNIIFIITPACKSSNEYLFEIERAKYEHMEKNLENIIVLLKGTAIWEMPTDFSYLWNNISIVKWTEDEDELDLTLRKLKNWLDVSPFSTH